MLKKICSNLIRKVEDPLIREKFKSRIHCVENSETAIIFVKDSLSIFDCPKPLKNSLSDFLSGSSRKRACEKHGNNEAQLDALLGMFYKKINAKKAPVRGVSYENVLDRLVINISNDCNLKCKYCYAGGGTYGGEKSFIDKETASATISKFFTAFDGINNIQFFGGEPLLKTSIISFICEEITRRHRKGEIKRLPRFALVTNGTLGTDDAYRLFKKYDIEITISLDGPEHVHDYLRGKGTFKKICQFINDLKANEIKYSFEATYTAHHLKSGVTLIDLLKFFYSEFNQREVHIPDVSLTSEHSLALDRMKTAELYREAVEYSIDSMKNGNSAFLSFASRIVDAYLEERPINIYCPAGLTTLSVDVEGYIYPCFMFTGNRDFHLGNVHNDRPMEKKHAKSIFNTMLGTMKKNNPECKKCWAAPFCSGCIGGDYIRNKGTFDKPECNVTKAMVEGFLTKAMDIDKSMKKENKSSLKKEEVIV